MSRQMVSLIKYSNWYTYVYWDEKKRIPAGFWLYDESDNNRGLGGGEKLPAGSL